MHFLEALAQAIEAVEGGKVAEVQVRYDYDSQELSVDVTRDPFEGRSQMAYCDTGEKKKTGDGGPSFEEARRAKIEEAAM